MVDIYVYDIEIYRDISYVDNPMSSNMMHYPLVSSNMAGWKLPELNGGL